MQEDFERINQKMLEFLEELERIPEKMLRESQQKMFEQAGADFSSFFGGGGQSSGGVDAYRILGLDKAATDEDVRTRYRERLRQFHPDTAGPGFEYHLQSVMAAYELIKRERGW